MSCFYLNLECLPSGPGCSKLTMSLVNILLKFQTLISEICHYFLLKKCEELLHCIFSTKNIRSVLFPQESFFDYLGQIWQYLMNICKRDYAQKRLNFSCS